VKITYVFDDADVITKMHHHVIYGWQL